MGLKNGRTEMVCTFDYLILSGCVWGATGAFVLDDLL